MLLTSCLDFTPERLGTRVNKDGVGAHLEMDYMGRRSCVSVLLPAANLGLPFVYRNVSHSQQ